jgi:uncharacterized protein YcfL
MKKLLFPSLILAGVTLLVAGCKTPHEGAYAPQATDKTTLENTSSFVLFDQGAQRSVTCSGIQQTTLQDGRLKVAANVRNRENRRIEVQINCEFKDEQGFVVDATPFRTLILDENAQENVDWTSMNAQAKKYTIRVRQAR